MQHKRLTASGVLGTSDDAHAKIHSVQLVAAGDAATVIGYKASTAVAGTEFMRLSAGANLEAVREFDGGLDTTLAWYFAFTGTTPQAHIVYE